MKVEATGAITGTRSEPLFSWKRFYCDCLSPDHPVTILVERDPQTHHVVAVSVETYLNRDTPWRNRLSMIRNILLNRPVCLSETIIMPENWEEFSEMAPLLRYREVEEGEGDTLPNEKWDPGTLKK